MDMMKSTASGPSSHCCKMRSTAVPFEPKIFGQIEPRPLGYILGALLLSYLAVGNQFGIMVSE